MKVFVFVIYFKEQIRTRVFGTLQDAFKFAVMVVNERAKEENRDTERVCFLEESLVECRTPYVLDSDEWVEIQETEFEVPPRMESDFLERRFNDVK